MIGTVVFFFLSSAMDDNLGLDQFVTDATVYAYSVQYSQQTPNRDFIHNLRFVHMCTCVALQNKFENENNGSSSNERSFDIGSALPSLAVSPSASSASSASSALPSPANSAATLSPNLTVTPPFLYTNRHDVYNLGPALPPPYGNTALLLKACQEKGYSEKVLQKLAGSSHLRGRLWEVLHERLAEGWRESDLIFLLEFCKSPLSFDSFLDEDMKRRFEFLPPAVARHVRNALNFICLLFSQVEFCKIFESIAPSLLEDLEGMDNSSRDGGCQDRALFFTDFFRKYKQQLVKKSYESIQIIEKNFVVLNYMLGCCQNRFGKNSFLHYPLPEQTQKFRIDDWLKNCIGEDKVRFLSEKNMDGFSAQISAVVSALNKVFFMSEEQLQALSSSQSFAVQIAKATHKSSFYTMRRFLESHAQIPIEVIWTHIVPSFDGEDVHVQATYARDFLAEEHQTASLAGYVIQLFSFNLTKDEAKGLEERVKTKNNLFTFMEDWAAYTDGEQHAGKAFSDLPILFPYGKLDRSAALERAKAKDKLAGVGHIYAAWMKKSFKEYMEYPESDVLTKPFDRNRFKPSRVLRNDDD